MSLKIYNSMAELKLPTACTGKHTNHNNVVDQLYNALKNSTAMATMRETLKDPAQLTNYLNCESAWVHLSVCRIVGIKYKDNNHDSILHLTGENITTMIKAHEADPSYSTTIDIFATTSALAEPLYESITKLNNLAKEKKIKLESSALLKDEFSGGFNNESSNVIKNVFKRYYIDSITYFDNKYVADINENQLYGGAIPNKLNDLTELSGYNTEQSKILAKPHQNRSSDLLKRLFDKVVTRLNELNKDIDPNTLTAINSNFDKLRNAEDQLLKILDALVVGYSLGSTGSKMINHTAYDADFNKYKGLFQKVSRREIRLFGTLGRLWAHVVPTIDLSTLLPTRDLLDIV